MKKPGYIYIMIDQGRSTLNIGATGNLEERVLQHKAEVGSQFTSRYKLTCLLYFEIARDVESAFKREKQLKNWHREWKLNLIKSKNPELIDLAEGWFRRGKLKNIDLMLCTIFGKTLKNSG